MYIRRVMWIDMEDRIRQVVESAQRVLAIVDSPVEFHLWVNPSIFDLINGVHALSRAHTTNTIYLIAGPIHHNVTKTFGERAPEQVCDSGAQMWFSQSPSGGVNVFMSPFRSALHSMKERELWVASYEEPVQLTVRKLNKHFETFARYLAETNMAARPSLTGYVFRLKLMMVDGRNRSELLRLIAKLCTDFLIPVAAIAIGAAVTIATAK